MRERANRDHEQRDYAAEAAKLESNDADFSASLQDEATEVMAIAQFAMKGLGFLQLQKKTRVYFTCKEIGGFSSLQVGEWTVKD